MSNLKNINTEQMPISGEDKNNSADANNYPEGNVISLAQFRNRAKSVIKPDDNLPPPYALAKAA